jgi:hypothetical protein
MKGLPIDASPFEIKVDDDVLATTEQPKQQEAVV